LLGLPIRQEPFQSADGDGPTFLSQNARPLALFLLRTDATANGREAVFLLDYLDTRREVPVGDTLDESGNVDLDRTKADALRLFALDTSRRFFDSRIRIVAQGHFAKVVSTHMRRLFGHVSATQVQLGLRSFGHQPVSREVSVCF
jgi:hypothetical protein